MLDPGLRSAAKAKELRISTLHDEGGRLLDMARRESRPIVAFTRHELDIFRTFAGLDISGCYRDAHKIARTWRSRCHPNEPIDGFALKDFLAFIGFPRGRYLGHQVTAGRIRYVRSMLQRKGDYGLLTSVAKGKWTKVLTHNEIDCRGMRQLTLGAAQELAASSPNSACTRPRAP